MDWQFEMTASIYVASRTGTVPAGGDTVSFAGPQYGATQGPFIAKQKRVVKYVQGPDGTSRPTAYQLICYQPIAFTDVIWPDGADHTDPKQGRPVLSVTDEDLIDEPSTRLYVVLC